MSQPPGGPAVAGAAAAAPSARDLSEAINDYNAAARRAAVAAQAAVDYTVQLEAAQAAQVAANERAQTTNSDVQQGLNKPQCRIM